MEDDFTAAEIRKEDGKTGELLYEDSLAKLVLYQVPEGEEDKPLADLMGEDNKLLDFERAGFKEWMEIWATGREEADAAGLNPIAKYDHRCRVRLKAGIALQKKERYGLNIFLWDLTFLQKKKRLPVMPQRIQFYLRSQIPVIWKKSIRWL